MEKVTLIDAERVFGSAGQRELISAMRECGTAGTVVVNGAGQIWDDGCSFLFYEENGKRVFNEEDYPHYKKVYELLANKIPNDILMKTFVLKLWW